MELLRELAIAFAMAVLAAWFLELFKPGKLTAALLWTVSRMLPREIRRDHYTDWSAEVEAIRNDSGRIGPFAAARFAVGQASFAVHLLRAQRRLDKARDPNHVSRGRAVLIFLSTPSIMFPAIPGVVSQGFELIVKGQTLYGFGWLGLAAWQVAALAYVLWATRVQGVPIVIGSVARRRAVRKR